MIMALVTGDEVRYRILEFLHKKSKEDPPVQRVHRSTLIAALRIPEEDMDLNMTYLAINNLVKFTQAPNVLWLWATITTLGKDVMERGKERYSERFPFILSAK
ncbi:MAG: hypothetical protein NWE80_00705 [Candidatus Bathyarchaeota archaeon]|nr:hypothetical protein [Candidatus Bathyarchaeota archaeon]